MTSLAIVVMLLAGACSADDTGAEDRSEALEASDGAVAERAQPADGYCATVNEITASTTSTGSGSMSSEDAFADLMAAFAAYAEFRNAIEDLADAAPASVEDEYGTIRDAFSRSPDLSDPLTAVAAALYTGIDVQIAADRIDDVTQEQCGVTLFALDAQAAADITTPYVDDEGFTVVNATNLFGEEHCDDVGSVVAATSETELVISCDNRRYLGIDLDAYRVDWSLDRSVGDETVIEDSTVFNEDAGLMGMVRVDATEASGFDGERREIVATGISLDDGTEVYNTTLPRPDGAVEETEVGGPSADLSIEAMGADGTMIVHATWPMTNGPWKPRLYGIAPDGTVSWQRNTDHRVHIRSNANDREYVELSAPNLDPDVISIATGESAMPSSAPPPEDTTNIFSDGCSSVFAMQSESGTTVLDAATGEAHTVKGWQPSVAPASQGAYIDGGGDSKSRFVTPTGVAWTIDAGLSSGPQVAYGRLFLENQSGALLEVDQETSKPVSEAEATLPPEGFPVKSGVLAVEGGSLGPIKLKLVKIEVLCG